jgi:predicted ATP-dependent endonuclease of OLD family
MLKKLLIKNLGCFDAQAEYSIDFSAETLIAGPNNAGKSMFLAGINLIRSYLVMGGLFWSSEFYNLSSFADVVHAHDESRTIEISMTTEDLATHHEYLLKITKGAPQFYVNGVLNAIRSQDRESMRKIWFFRPNRSLVPYQSPIQPSASILQPLRSDGSNVTNFLLERWTDRDKRWSEAESWLKKIDPDMTEMKTPIKGDRTFFETMISNVAINVSLQGSGFQSAAAIIAAIIFSPDDSVIVVEEPEVYLHPDSQEVIVDLINNAVSNHGKQVVLSTHSCNILLPFYNDVGQDGARRGANHVAAIPDKFSLWTFKKTSGKASIELYPLKTKTFRQFRDDFKQIWG